MQDQDIRQQVTEIFARYGLADKLRGDLAVTSPLTGAVIGAVSADSAADVAAMVARSVVAQLQWKAERNVRVSFLQLLRGKIREHTADLATLVHLDSGKSVRESTADVASTIALIENTIETTSYEPLPSGAERSKEYTPLGVIAIIEPFNFFSIKLWTGIPALLAGNTVVCKASENTTLATILFAEIVRRTVKDFNAGKSEELAPDDLFQIAIGGPEVGKALVADPRVAKVVVTGSIAVCTQVKAADSDLGRTAKALAEGGAANFVIVSGQHEGMERFAYLDFVVGAMLKSVLPYGGQKCIGARLMVVHESILDDFVGNVEAKLGELAARWQIGSAFSEDNTFEYSPLINDRASQRFEWALRETLKQGGRLIGGERLEEKRYPGAYYYRPACGVFPAVVPLMAEEIFGPYFAIVPYAGSIEEALLLAQKPNARLVNAYYGSDPREAKLFKSRNDAGFTLINPPQGTGLLPPYGLGFGGNGLSGQGESFARDPESIFVRPDGAIKRCVTFRLPG